MKLDRFRAYLGYMGCEMVGFTPSSYLYANSASPGNIARFGKHDPIDPASMYWTCTLLGIDMPPDYESYQEILDRIP